jgi:murein DD-endopeptidase MepM/ murein hydrolase activator NlpD
MYSLYGHLASADLQSLKVGDAITAGQLLCHLGKPEENGGWPPHLHFQLIHDMQTWRGDYPGVCSKRDVDFYRDNCPDPRGVLFKKCR